MRLTKKDVLTLSEILGAKDITDTVFPALYDKKYEVAYSCGTFGVTSILFYGYDFTCDKDRFLFVRKRNSNLMYFL